jgi:hypothetical protein
MDNSRGHQFADTRREPSGNPNAALRFSQTGAGLKLQLDLTISREMNSQNVER